MSYITSIPIRHNFYLFQGWHPGRRATQQSKGQGRCCPFCNAKFSTKRDLTGHLADVHDSKQRFKCHICGKALGTQHNLNFHIANHTGEQAYQCSICGKKMAQKTNYVAHMNKHTGATPFQCKKCFKGYSSQQQLCNHKKVCTETLH